MKTSAHFIMFFSFLLVVAGCKKEPNAIQTETAKPSPVFVRLKDAPGPYTAVNVDIQGIEITVNGNPTMLNVSTGIYNLLNFSNGIDTLIATGSITGNTVEQIRLILGPNNSVTSGNVTYSLSTPSAQQSGLKLQVHQNLSAGVAYYVLLDFDALKSIVVEGNGSYSLKPVIRTVDAALSGAIKGQIVPAAVATTVTAVFGSNTYSTTANINGDFIISGVPAGTYSLSATPIAPYNVVNLNNINVTVGATTNTGTLSI